LFIYSTDNKTSCELCALHWMLQLWSKWQYQE
jgi:hypothetical protein